jgi:hypothetical protein
VYLHFKFDSGERALNVRTTGAAIDKVRALEAAGAIVTDSPAKIGVEMLKVS